MLEKLSLDISNFFVSQKIFNETNNNSGTFVAFDYHNNKLSQINTNIDLDEEEMNFDFDSFVKFIVRNDFNFVLALRSLDFLENPSENWTNTLIDSLKKQNVDYDEFKIGRWPTPIPKFDVHDKIFILRYCYNDTNQVDKGAANNTLFGDLMKNSDYEDSYEFNNFEDGAEKIRVITMVSDIENLVLHNSFIK
tara:strand:- start:2171 stop:2749 length:579 start_codon:yes stop_codon:yes gene_type:complete